MALKVFKDEDAKGVFIPKSKSQSILIEEIEHGAINDPLLVQANMDLSGPVYKIYTVASMFLRACIVLLDARNELDVGGFMTMERDARESEEAEKTGNLVANIKPGYILKAIAAKENVELGLLDIHLPGMEGFISIPVKHDFTEDDKNIMLKIQTIAAKLLSGYKYGLVPEQWTIYVMAFLFLKHATLIAMMHAVNDEYCMVNIADIIELSVRYDKETDTFKVKCKPSKEAKLEVKSDGVTET